jgi:ABC-2 type transport system permease protein
MNLLTSLRKEMIEQWRTSRLLVLAIVLLLFGLTSPLLAKYTPEMLKLIPGAEQFAGLIPQPTLLDAVAQYIKNIGQFGVLLALLMSMGTMSVEKERGTAALMLVKPLPRGSFLVAKFLALALSFLAAVALAALAGYYYTLVLFGPMDWGAWLALNGLMWLEMLVYVALTMLFSTLLHSQAAAAGLGLGALLVLSLVGSLPTALGDAMPDKLVSWGASLFTSQAASAWPALWVSLILILASLLAAWLSFRKQEL